MYAKNAAPTLPLDTTATELHGVLNTVGCAVSEGEIRLTEDGRCAFLAMKDSAFGPALFVEINTQEWPSVPITPFTETGHSPLHPKNCLIATTHNTFPSIIISK